MIPTTDTHTLVRLDLEPSAITPLALRPSDLDTLRVAWETGGPPPLIRRPATPPAVGQRFWVREPFRLLVRSYSSAVIYGDGRISAGFMDVPVEERDTATYLDTRNVMDAVPKLGAEYTHKVLAAGGVTSAIRFHPAKKMPEWAARWEIEVVEVRRNSMAVRVRQRHRVCPNPTEWTVAEVRRVLRLWAALEAARKSPNPTRSVHQFAQAVWRVYCEPSTGRVRYAAPTADRNVLRVYLLRLPAAIRHPLADQVGMGLRRRAVDRQHMRTRGQLDELLRALWWDAPRAVGPEAP